MLEGNKLYNNKSHGIALITVLYVMVILFILSMGVLELINTNIGLSANIPARIQALNLANAGIMLAMDDLKKNYDPNTSYTPPANFVTPYKPANYDLPGKCIVTYYDNLKDHGDKIVNPSDIPSEFAPYINTTTKVYKESAIILSQGEYKGFKRTIKAQVKFSIYGTGAEGKIQLSDGPFMLAGMTGNSRNPLISVIGSSTVFFSKNGIEYKDLTGARFYDSSQLYTSATASITKTGGGTDIPTKYAITKNSSDLPELPTWSIWDYLPSSYVTAIGNIGDPNILIPLPDPNNTDSYYDPNNPSLYKAIDPNDPYNQIRIEPCPPVTGPTEPANSIFTDNHKLNPNQEYYYHRGNLPAPGYGTVYITQDTFINGNLHLNEGLTLGGPDWSDTPVNLFVNGNLTVDGVLYGYGNIFVAKHFVAAAPDPNIAVDLKFVRFRSAGWGRDNVRIFAEGDIRLGTPPKSDAFSFPIPGGCNETHINTGLSDMPLDAKLVEDTFKKLGLTDTIDYTWYPPDNTSLKGFTIKDWFESDTGDPKFDGTALARVPGLTGEEILQGKSPNIAIPEEVSTWFKSSHGDCCFKWACYISMPGHANWNTRWEMFTAHPNFFQSCYDVFFAGTLYSHGNITTENADVPIRIIGGTVATGDIILTKGSSVVIYPLYFDPQKGPALITPVLLVYTWEEL